MKTNFVAGAMGAALALGSALPVAAQTIDYGSLEQLFGEPVTTSATGKPQRVSDAPVNMEIITADDIRRTGAANVSDVLQRVVGVDVARWGVASADVSVRGYNSARTPRLLVLVNGRQVYADHLGYTPWYAIPVEMAEIRQIEVVKGPSTALFGFNAVAGVVNIVTYSPLNDDVNNVTARFGTQDHRELSAVTTLKLGERGGVRLSAGGLNSDEFDTPGRPQDSTSLEPRRRSVSIDGQYRLTDDVVVGAEVTKVHAEMAERSLYGMLPSNYDTMSAKASVNANTSLGLMSATVYRNQLDMDIIGALDYKNVVTVAQLQDLFKIGTAHSVRLSAEYRHNSLDSTPIHNGTISYDVYSAGAMWDWALSDHLSLVNAGRVDHLRLKRTGAFAGPAPFTNDDYDRSLTEYSFNSGIVYKATDVDTLRFSVGRGIQAPALFEYSVLQSIGGGTQWRYGNPDIDPSIVMNYEVGYDRAIDAINGAFRASVYYQTNTDLKSYARSYTTTPPVSIYDNMGDSKAVGFDTQLKGRVGSDWSWKVGYAYERIVDDLVPGSGQNFEDSQPKHKISAELGYANGPWEANLFGQYVSQVQFVQSASAGEITVPDYLYVGARVGYEVAPGVQVALTGMNVTQDEARLVSQPAEERRVYLTLSASF
ncbi:TonB-dependent receptor plug domain-containing protein [Azospirillum sp. ST 5-10]|uniref:TonB-dependent receptor plug domain-containing protein n=1 Tax=unclassified Azospirillum TaxID=2630922 RepID=UPI003F49E1AD